MQTTMQKQRGAVLVVSLIFLLLITAIAVTTISSSTFQTIMASNFQQRESILRVAESAAEQPLNVTVLPLAYNSYFKWKGTNLEADRAYSVPTAQLITTQSGVSMSAQVLYMGVAIAEGADPTKQKYVVYESRGSAQSSDSASYADAKLATQVVQGVAKITNVGAGGATYDP